MKAWIYTLIDLVILGVVYFGTSWLLGGNSSQAGFAICIAAFTLLKTYKERTA